MAAVHVADALTEALESGRDPVLAPELMDELGEPEMVEEWHRQAAEVAAETCV